LLHSAGGIVSFFFETRNIRTLIAHDTKGMTTRIDRRGTGNVEEDCLDLLGLYLKISKYMKESPVLQSEEHPYIRQMVPLNVFKSLGLCKFGVQFVEGSEAEQKMKHEGPSKGISWLGFVQYKADEITPIIFDQCRDGIDKVRQAMGMPSIDDAVAAMNTWLYSHTPDGEERAYFLPADAKVLPHHALMMDTEFLNKDTNWPVIAARQQSTAAWAKE
jgi:hypothetical protein